MCLEGLPLRIPGPSTIISLNTNAGWQERLQMIISWPNTDESPPEWHTASTWVEPNSTPKTSTHPFASSLQRISDSLPVRCAQRCQLHWRIGRTQTIYGSQKHQNWNYASCYAPSRLWKRRRRRSSQNWGTSFATQRYASAMQAGSDWLKGFADFMLYRFGQILDSLSS